MCLALPASPPTRTTGTGKEPGPIKIFVAGIIFMTLMLFYAMGSLWRGLWKREERE